MTEVKRITAEEFFATTNDEDLARMINHLADELEPYAALVEFKKRQFVAAAREAAKRLGEGRVKGVYRG